MEKVKLERSKLFSAFVKQYPKYFTHGKGRFFIAAKWDSPGYCVFSFGEDISVKYNKKGELNAALKLLIGELGRGNKGIIKIRRL